MTTGRGTNQDRVLETLRLSARPLDDDEIATRVGIQPRQQVNQICRRLQAEGRIDRRPGPSGKIVNSLAGREMFDASPPPVRNRSMDPAWPWEGAVQQSFVAALDLAGWTVTSAADTAVKARGVDVLAEKGERRLGAEVKGWPGTTYADSRRAGERKPTQPSTQAGHWFAQALMKAMMLLDSHQGHESLVVVPDGHPRYHDLARRTSSGRTAAGIHVIFVAPTLEVRSETWTP
jgi:hypothetical protein